MTITDAPLGLAKGELDTPALLVDLDTMEKNIARVAAECRAHGVAWRPHSKAHKTPQIGQLQIAAGAIGVTCAKLGEAEVMAAAGIGSILVANQIVGAAKISRLMALGRLAEIIVAVDSLANLDELDASARAAGRRQPVVIELDVGMRRAGLSPGPGVAAFAQAIADRPGLDFAGLTAWESHAVAIADPAEKQNAVAEALARVTDAAAACAAAGLPARIVSCGGTGTFPYCVRQPGVTEVQVGGAIFADLLYRESFALDLPTSLTILTTVVSRPTPTRIIVDAGKKAMSCDAAMPRPLGLGPLAGIRLSAEHTTIELASPSDDPPVGGRLEFLVGYSDTTVHLHEEIVGVRNGAVERRWTVAARGKLK